MLRRIFAPFFILFISSAFFHLHAATPTISDSIDITHTTIILDITDYGGHTISGNAVITCKAKVDNINSIPLDLLALTVDSVVSETGILLTFSHVGELLTVETENILNIGDSTTFTVYYGGEPDLDGSWGGWYWSGDYSYQLGVGFDAIPHNFGRIWFPCFDNFIERSTFRYIITTADDKKAFCGGLLESETDNGDGTITWIWNCMQTIPSYLASVAVCKYATIDMIYPGLERDIPVQIGAKPEDTADVISSFINLFDALEIFETKYLPYQWDRVGYSIVPFSGGAMEHAMNIAYPLFAITGTTTWESVYVHELSHHWWGDLITTSRAEEMWINEGWAVYSEHLFQEFKYGETAYRDVVKANQTNVLHYCAANEDNYYYPISNVPQDHTYGYTTYQKGADVIHTLRGYMGDALFFECIQSFLETYKFKAVSAADFRDHLTACSGIDMNDFFDGWVYQAGSPGFEIDDIGRNDYSAMVNICIQQKLNHAPAYCNNVPLTISFFDNTWNKVASYPVMMTGDKMQFSLPAIEATYAIIDYDEKINDAVTEDEVHIQTAGTYHLENGLMDIDVTAMSDSFFVYAQHHWVAADNFKTAHPGIHLNTQRYWTITTNASDDIDVLVKFLYNGQETLSGGYLDNEFISNHDDSLVLFYRAGPQYEWTLYPDYILNTWGSVTDKRGAFELSKLQSGEYAFGIYDATIADAPLDITQDCPDDLEIALAENNFMKIFPVPANDFISVQVQKPSSDLQIRIVNISGDTVGVFPIHYATQSIPVKNLPSGTYQLYVENALFERIAAQKIMIIH